MLLAPAGAFAQPGDLDPSFGQGGVTITPLNQEESFSPGFRALAIPPSGEVIAAGTQGTNGGAQQAVIATYGLGGSLDSSFGNGGLAIGTQHCPVEECLQGTRFSAVAMSGEKILGVGSAEDEGIPGALGIYLARFNANGTPDTTFGNKGNESFTVVGPHGEVFIALADAVAVQANGKILVGGTTLRGQGGGEDAFVVRLNADGSFDSSFDGGTGDIEEQFSGSTGGETKLNAMALQPSDGSILITGSIRAPGLEGSRTYLARLTSEGHLDTTFASGGVAKETLFPTSVEGGSFPTSGGTGVAVEGGGGILVAGGATELTSTNNRSVGFLARFTPSGGVDTTYGQAGVSQLPFQINTGLAITSGDEAIVAGRVGAHQTQLAAMLPSGVSDPRFASSPLQLGKTPEVSGNGPSAEPFALALDPSERILIAGFATDGSVVTNGASEVTGFVARFDALPAGPPPPLVATGAAGNVTPSSATIAGTVNSEGPQATYYFEYGPSQSYGIRSDSQPASAGIMSQAVTTSLNGLSADAVFHYRLVASGAGGTSYGSDQSFATLPSPSSGPSGGGSTGTGSGGGGVLGGQTVFVSSSQIAALLARQLTPSGKAAKIAALLKEGGFTVAFKALEAGTALIDWYEVPAGARLAKKAKPRPVLVAVGQRTFLAAGIATIKIKLTPAGKRLLKHANKLKLTAKGTFTPNGGRPVIAFKTFVPKR